MLSRLRYVCSRNRLMALVPRSIKYTLLADLIESVITRTRFLDGGDEPPRLIEYVGGGFLPIGNHLVQLMMARAGLADGMAVLEIGCGIGRVAVALNKRTPNISYLGFDVVNYGILWCRKRFSRFPKFRFEHADVFNSFFNPRGSKSASEYRFPSADCSVDFACATSVFTHMPAAEVAHYLRELGRCLKYGGKAYFTAFVLDEESRRQVASGAALFSFRHLYQETYIEKRDEPDLAVAYDRLKLEAMVADAGLEVVAYYPGRWRGLEYEDGQDAYVVQKSTRQVQADQSRLTAYS